MLWFHKGTTIRIFDKSSMQYIQYTQVCSVRIELSLVCNSNFKNTEPMDQHTLLRLTDTGIGISLDFFESRAFGLFAHGILGSWSSRY